MSPEGDEVVQTAGHAVEHADAEQLLNIHKGRACIIARRSDSDCVFYEFKNYLKIRL